MNMKDLKRLITNSIVLLGSFALIYFYAEHFISPSISQARKEAFIIVIWWVVMFFYTMHDWDKSSRRMIWGKSGRPPRKGDDC